MRFFTSGEPAKKKTRTYNNDFLKYGFISHDNNQFNTLKNPFLIYLMKICLQLPNYQLRLTTNL